MPMRLAPRRYRILHRGFTAKDYGQVVHVVVTTLEQFQEHGADAALWRRLGRRGQQTLTDAMDNPYGGVLFRDQEARADAEEERRRAAEREAQRPVCKRCGGKCIDQRRRETTVHRTAWNGGDVFVCGTCHVAGTAREKAAPAPPARTPHRRSLRTI
ncbi:hypothetical protein FHS42_006312 [Streptomyces zagrosensis]|uniref:Uncharacterized protein n=1 Tax=Streptomyces zagrosensis TaxID=1042984 RepID=A0A7W9QFT4_9ACTN|nr:hypothetical protein [Streptomyces zagrosensis]